MTRFQSILRLLAAIACALASLAMPTAAVADGALINLPYLGPGFVFESAGSATSNSGEVITGQGSVKGTYFGTNSYNGYLVTDPSIIPLTPGQTYTVTFRYKILSAPNIGFEVLFYSPTGGAAGVWLPSYTIKGVASDTGVATLTNTLGPYSDYRVSWDIVGTGAISIDDIQVTSAQTGAIVAQENAERVAPAYVFGKPRTSYLLNLAANGTDVVDKSDSIHTLVPFGMRMSFAGSIKYSKDTSYIVHHVRSHAETYDDPRSIADLPVDFLRTAPPFAARGDSPFSMAFRFPDRVDKAIVGYVNSMEFGGASVPDPAFDAAWDKDGDGIIDPGVTNLPAYVDTKVFNAAWKNYVAAYWTDSWRAEMQYKLDVVATEHFDGVMFDVMTGYWAWKSAYPSMDVNVLRQQYVDFVKWASNYARTTYGNAFLITFNLDGDVKDYFPDLGKYVDAGYFQGAFFDWSGSGVVSGYGLSTAVDHFSNPRIDFIRNQGMSVLDMDQIGTGNVNPGLNFVNYDSQITKSNLLKLFAWAVSAGSTPYSTTEFFGLPYTGGFPRFVRVLPGLPPFTNTPYDDWVLGSDQDDTISTGDGDDLIYGGPGNDTIDGGSGANTAYYVGARANFTIRMAEGKIVVSDQTGAEGTDTLTNILYLQFADQVVDLGPFFSSASLSQTSVGAGWNLLGNSLNAPLSVASVFGNADNVVTVWKWTAATSGWAFYTPSQTDGGASYAATKGYDRLTTINGGEGYWVNAKQPFTAQFPLGTPIQSNSFQDAPAASKRLPSGWSLISVGDDATARGFNSAVGVAPPSAGSIPENVRTLWAWDNASGKWYFYAPSLDALGGTTLGDYLVTKGYLDFSIANRKLTPGTGFWVNRP